MILPPAAFQTCSLKKTKWGMKVSRVLAACINAVEPGELVNKFLVRNKNYLLFGEEKLNLISFERVILVGVGKAAYPMSIAVANLLGEYLTRGTILTKTNPDELPKKNSRRIKILTGGHPVPDPTSQKSAEYIKTKLSKLTPNDLVLFLISGGGSALLASPSPGISLDDLVNTNQLLLSCGAEINEINTIRKHISSIKGGRLASLAAPAKLITLILSDVIGDPIDMIASGPTLPDSSTFQDAMQIINKYKLEAQLPEVVVDRIIQGCSGDYPETPKPGDPIFDNTSHYIVGRNLDAIQAGILAAEREGFNASILPDPLSGEASQVGAELAEYLLKISKNDKRYPRPACLIGGGETTVTITTNSKIGRGGRNLELALNSVKILDGTSNVALITLATDGEDGTTDAAGAVVTGESFKKGKESQMQLEAFLENHDSYSYFLRLDDLLQTGPTQTNVNDLCFLFTFNEDL
jgi:hydroxypyruvate reductase